MNILTLIGDFAVFSNTDPHLNVVQIRDYYFDSEGETIAKEFRSSTDKILFSAWNE